MVDWLNASTLIWGVVNEWAPYHCNGWAPATRPSVDLTLWVLRPGEGTVELHASKQGALPITVFDRQPTFDDIAGEAISVALGSL